MNLKSPRYDPYSTLEQTKQKLQKKGYTATFHLSSDGEHIEDTQGHRFGINNVALNGVYKLTAKENQSDYKVLYALSTSKGINGLLQDGYGKSGSETVIHFMQQVEDQGYTS